MMFSGHRTSYTRLYLHNYTGGFQWQIRRNLPQETVLFDNTARAIGDAPKEVKIRHTGNCLKADPAYGKGVADALCIPLSKVTKG
jgi:catalase